MTTQKLKPQTFVLRPGGGLVQAFRMARQFIRALLERGPVELIARPFDEGRSARANRLMWHWNGEAAMQLGTSPDWQHGEWKHDVLLGLMRTWDEHYERAEFIADVLDELPTRKLRVFAAHKLVESRDLTVGRFGEALDAYRRHYTRGGVVLTDGADLLNEIREAERARASRTARPPPAGLAA